MDRPTISFGSELRRWRLARGLTQLALSLQAEVSARHLSWLESGKSDPSRAMVLRLAERLDLPLRERNALLRTAGYAPMFGEYALGDAALAPAQRVLQQLLDAHEPAPALLVDRHWTLLAHNRVVPLLLHAVAEPLRRPPVNVLRLSLHPQGLAPWIENLPAWRAHVLQRLQRQVQATADPVLVALHAELSAQPGAAADADEGAAPAGEDGTPHQAAIVPLVLNTPIGRLAFLTTITLFGAPHDVTLSELAIETLLPADAATGETLRRLLESAVRS